MPRVRPLKALGDFDEVREAMNEKCGPRRLTVRLACVVNRGAHNAVDLDGIECKHHKYGYYWLIVRT